MDYIGSKVKLNEWLFEIIGKNGNGLTFLDGCSGSGAVSRKAAECGYNVISCDLMAFPSNVANGSIGLSTDELKQSHEIIDYLNNMEGMDGYFLDNFGECGKSKRLYFNCENARKIDAIRKHIDTIKENKVRDYIIFCCIEAISKVSNTAGVHGAYLKKLKDRATKAIIIEKLEVVPGLVTAFSMDLLSLLSDERFREKHKEDILYIDPPYNQRQYTPNYHLFETFVKNDFPEAKGKTGLRDWKKESNSIFCKKTHCLAFLEKIVNATVAKNIFVSYSSDGLLDLNDFANAFKNIEIQAKSQKRYVADTSKKRKYDKTNLFEYLIKIRKY